MSAKQPFFSGWLRILILLVAVPGVILLIPWLNQLFFGILLPYLAALVLVFGFIGRILSWARSPVPFRIPTTSGQQGSLPWIKQAKLDNPSSFWGVAGRMFLEVFFFRSLFRNTKAELKDGPTLVYGGNKLLWAAGLAFHWSFLIIVIRHMRFFTEPVPGLVLFVQNLDSLFQIGVPVLCLTDLVILGALSFLLLRRVVVPQLRYLSLPADYFALILLLAIIASGVFMTYFVKIDIVAVKKMAMGLVSLSPSLDLELSSFFLLHLYLVCLLMMYFPFSKLMHAGGVFFSPTRNLANNNRARRHVNPWNPTVKIHTYEEYEDEFRDVMKAAGMPLEKE
jgi:nitrate reductase gamma subunit